MGIKRICHNCIGEKYLSNQVLEKGLKKRCTYCHQLANTFTIEDIAKKVGDALLDHFTRSSTEPDDWEYLNIRYQSGYVWERHGDEIIPLIEDVALLPFKAAEDIQEVLEYEHYDHGLVEIGEESEFASDTYYVRKDVDVSYWEEEWEKFEVDIKMRARFFNKRAHEYLNEVFEGILNMHSSDGTPLLLEIGPKSKISSLYRARVFQNHSKIESALEQPANEFGPPPTDFATSGRMNAKGIPVFYGATQKKTAIAEVRPPVGSYITVAKFKIIRKLTLLDLTALTKVKITGSVFDETYLKRLQQAKFLMNLSKRITKLVMPNDESIDYLVTQAIADYLSVGSDLKIDGIIYPSAQVNDNSNNIVLFHKSARVEQLRDVIKMNVNTGYWDEEGWNTEYKIQPVNKIQSGSWKDNDDFDDLPDKFQRRDHDNRDAALRIDLNSIQVHLLKRVTYSTKCELVEYKQP